MNKEEASKSLKWGDLAASLTSLWKAHKGDRMTYELPREAASQTILAKRLSLHLCEGSGCWAQIRDWGAFPNAINYDLFYGYRLGHGDRRSLEEASVYAFGSADTDHFVSIISMALYFSWDVWVFDSHETWVLEISNDETIEFFAEASELRTQLTSEFARLNMRGLRADRAVS